MLNSFFFYLIYLIVHLFENIAIRIKETAKICRNYASAVYSYFRSWDQTAAFTVFQ